MKKFLLLLLLFAACKKSDTEPSKPSNNVPISGCNIDMAKFKDVTWHHLTGSMADLVFTSSGNYFENGTDDGDWSHIGCDSIYVTRPSNNFYYRINSVTDDTLKLINPAFGIVTYYR